MTASGKSNAGPAPAAHWAESYVGRPYDGASYDCADLVADVMSERFGRKVDLPGRAAGIRGLDRQIADAAAQLADPVDDPREGDLVLMRAAGRRSSIGHHVGICCWVAGRAHVLHARPGLGACLHPLDGLRLHALELAGTYRWR